MRNIEVYKFAERIRYTKIWKPPNFPKIFRIIKAFRG